MRRAGCQRDEHPAIGRRELLQVGGLSLLGTGMTDLLRLEAQAAEVVRGAAPRAKSVVLIFQSGGPSQHETFDPKPEAPAEIRGEYGTTQTRHAGIRFCEYLPKLSLRSDKFSIVRTMHHTADRQFRNEHNSATYLLHTGTTEMPEGDNTNTITAPRQGRITWPSIGSMIAYAAPTAPHVGWPAVVEIPRGNLMSNPVCSARVIVAGAWIWQPPATPRMREVPAQTATATMIPTIPPVLRAPAPTRGGTTRAAASRCSICPIWDRTESPSRS